MQDLFGGGVHLPIAKQPQTLGVRVENLEIRNQAPVNPLKLKCHAVAEQMHTDTLVGLLHVINELRAELDRERGCDDESSSFFLNNDYIQFQRFTRSRATHSHPQIESANARRSQR